MVTSFQGTEHGAFRMVFGKALGLRSVFWTPDDCFIILVQVSLVLASGWYGVCG